MQSRREQLTPAVRARTIAAACDHVCLRVLGDDDAAGPQAYRGIYLDGAGAAYLVVRREVAAPAHAVRISCRTHLSGLGVLSLEGTCGRRLPAGDHPAAHHGDYDLIHVDLRVIRVLAPATGSAPAQCLRIGLADFSAAEADPWAMDTEPHRARLERDHQGPLRVIAALAQGAAIGVPWTVVVRELHPGHLDLACLADDGVGVVRLEYDRSMDSPEDVATWVARSAVRPA